MAFGVEIDDRTPEAVAVSYVKLVDTCEAKAARRAFELLVDPASVERSLFPEARKRFGSQGLCFDPNEAPAATIPTRLLNTDPVNNTALPADTVLVLLDAETSRCDGGETEGLAVNDVQGKWRVDAEQTEALGDDDLLDSGCVGEG